jgi:hypothetical protein
MYVGVTNDLERRIHERKNKVLKCLLRNIVQDQTPAWKDLSEEWGERFLPSVEMTLPLVEMTL